MTVRAFVLIQTEIEVAKTADVVAALKKLGSEIQSVDRVTGPYDTIVVIEVDTLDKIDVRSLREAVAIGAVSGLRMVNAEEWPGHRTAEEVEKIKNQSR